jgi:hypothetical protein
MSDKDKRTRRNKNNNTVILPNNSRKSMKYIDKARKTADFKKKKTRKTMRNSTK